MRILLLSSLAIAAPALAGPDREFGATVLRDEAVQIVEIHPRYSGKIMEGASGHRSAAAVLRYEEGKLKPLLRTNGKPDVGEQGGAGDSAGTETPIVGNGPN